MSMKPVLLVLGPVMPSTYKYALTATLILLPYLVVTAGKNRYRRLYHRRPFILPAPAIRKPAAGKRSIHRVGSAAAETSRNDTHRVFRVLPRRPHAPPATDTAPSRPAKPCRRGPRTS